MKLISLKRNSNYEVYDDELNFIGKLCYNSNEFIFNQDKIKYQQISYHLVICDNDPITFLKDESDEEEILYYIIRQRGCDNTIETLNKLYEIFVYKNCNTDKIIHQVKNYYHINKNLPQNEIKNRIKNMTHYFTKDNKCYEAELPDDLISTSFTWDPKDRKIRDLTQYDIDNLECVCKVISLHEWAYYGFFKPTISEAISFLPQSVFDDLDSNDKLMINTALYSLNDDSIIDNYHIGITSLYKYNRVLKKIKSD